jgi:hypothetical protein
MTCILAAERRATPHMLAYLQRTLHDHYTADNLLGPRVLLPVIRAHLDTMDRLRHTATGDILTELLRIGARYAEFAGWLSHDTGDLVGAAQLCGQALEWAQVARDDQMASFVLMRRAAQALSARDGTYAAFTAEAAQRYDSDETIRYERSPPW